MLLATSGKRLSDLVETLLDVSRIAHNRISLDLSEFDLVQACQESIVFLQEMIAQSGCGIRFAMPTAAIHGYWDRLRIEHALMNLISNACKYAPQSAIEIGVEVIDQQVKIWISVTGPGIAEEHIERIFSCFERAVSDTNYGGWGLDSI